MCNKNATQYELMLTHTLDYTYVINAPTLKIFEVQVIKQSLKINYYNFYIYLINGIFYAYVIKHYIWDIIFWSEI